MKFQSTLSVRRATWNLKDERRFLIISIHALRKESDHLQTHILCTQVFQSTLSVRRAT